MNRELTSKISSFRIVTFIEQEKKKKMKVIELPEEEFNKYFSKEVYRLLTKKD